MKKIIIKTIVLVFSLLTFSCNDLLEEKAYDFVAPENLGDSEAAANQFLMGVYNTLSESSFFKYGAFLYMLNMDCDYATGADWAFGNVGAGNPLDFWGYTSLWQGPYTLIHRANMAISYINKMNNLSEAFKTNILGELSFLKAWAYFILVRNYGPLPIYRQSISEGIDRNQPRQPVEKVYEHIIELLGTAEKMYPANDAAFVPGHASGGAAKALLAKVYLTIASASLSSGTVKVKGGTARVKVGDTWEPVLVPQVLEIAKEQVTGYENFNSQDYFALARDKAWELIQSGQYDLLPYDELWTVASRNKTEHVWSLQAISGDATFGNAICRDYVGINKADGTIEGSWYGLSDHWYSLFEEGDKRVTDGVVHRWATGLSGEKPAYRYYPSSYKSKVDNKEAYNSIGDKYDGTETFQKAAGWSCAKLLKFAAVSNRTVVQSDFHFPFLRYADVLLVYAEAANEANNGPTDNAYQALNKVRERSGASALSGLDQVDFRSTVIEERARELALEGDRRYDLFRWGIYLQVMNAIDIDGQGILKRRIKRNLLYPVPVGEITANKAFGSNNEGW